MRDRITTTVICHGSYSITLHRKRSQYKPYGIRIYPDNLVSGKRISG